MIAILERIQRASVVQILIAKRLRAKFWPDCAIPDTNGKVTNSQLDTTNENQEVSPFPAVDHKVHINRRTQRHSKHKKKNIKHPQKHYRLGRVSKKITRGLKPVLRRANHTASDVEQDT